MQKIKKLITKYAMWIIIILFALLTLKTCQSAQRKNTQEFIKIEYQKEIDSLKSIIDIKGNEVMVLQDSLNVLNTELKNTNSTIQSLNQDKAQYQRLSEQLAKNTKRR